MYSHSRVGATTTDKLYFVIVLEAVYGALKYPLIKASNVQPSLGREVTRVLLRALHDLDRFSIAQLQWALPSSVSTYRRWIAANAVTEGVPDEVVTETIGAGAKLHWIGHMDAEKVILYYHGGGYVLPLSNLHLNFNSFIRREVKRQSGLDVKLAFLDYTLAPEHTYPSQFCQAVLALQHVLDSGVSPTDIIISGDSVGGQLALQILSHLLHPHPSLQRIQAPDLPFAGILALSPWVIYESNAPTFKHKHRDILTPNTLLTLSRIMRQGGVFENEGTESDRFWSEPLVAPPEWWHSTAQATRDVLITYGAHELFTEDNAALAEKMREGSRGTGVDIKDVEEPHGLHIGPLIDAYFGRTPSDTSRVIVGWVTECLKN